MGFLFADSFDHYSIGEITRKWTVVGGGNGNPNVTTTFSNGRHSSNGLNYSFANSGSQSGAPDAALVVLPASGDTCIAGFAFLANGHNLLGVSTSEILSNILFRVGHGSTTQIWFRVNTDGTISALRATTVLGTSAAAVSEDVRTFLEFKIVIHSSTGTITVRKDGVNILSLTSQNTNPVSTGTWTNIQAIKPYFSTSATAVWNADDYYVCDASGSTSNDFLNDVRVDAMFPNANGNSSQWTRSTGADQYATVDENPPNDDTDYNSTATVNNKDTMNFPNAPVAGADIFAVQLVATARKTDSGSAGHKGVLRSGGTDYLSSEIGVTSTYSMLRSIWDRDPADSGVITETDFNGFEFGYQKSA